MSDKHFTDADELARLIGLITMQWNRLHHYACACFPFALGGNANFSGAVLDAIKSDDTQRKVVLAVVRKEAERHQNQSLSDRAKVIFNRIGALSSERNGFVHSAWIQSGDEGILPNSIHTKPHGGINQDQIRTQAHDLIAKIKILEDEVIALGQELLRATAPQ